MGARWERDHIWLYILGLGFDPEAYGEVFTEKTLNTLNRSACSILVHFLFTKLDPSRAEVDFRDCCLPGCDFMNHEFRNKCYKWLKDLSVKEKKFPVIPSSAFLAPDSSRFIHQFYQFTRHVMCQDLEANSLGVDIPFAEAVESKPEDVHMAKARCRVAYNKLQRIFQKEDFVMQEYEQKAQLFIGEIEQIKSEYEALQIQSCNMKQNDENKSDKTKRIQKVRSMWTSITDMWTSLKREEELVASVLHILDDHLGQCILDGNVFGIPQVLVHRVEGNVHQCCTRNVYEGKNINFLAVIRLLNEALRALRDEHCQSEFKQLQAIERMVTFCRKARETLNAKRLEIEQQHSVSARASVSRNQEDWEVKWKSFLGLHPFDLISDQDRQLGLLRSSSPCSSDLAEEREEHSIFSQHLSSASDIYGCIHEVLYEKDDVALETRMDKSTPSPRCPPSRLSSMPLELSEVSENREVLIEKSLHIGTCKGEKMPVPPKTVKSEKDESSTSEAQEDGGDHTIQRESPVKKGLKKASDELAEEVARTVMSDSPQGDEGKGVSLDILINLLSSYPSLTRKQTPQTPDLLTGIRSSWKKAIQTEGSSEILLAPAEIMIEEAPMDNTPIMQKAADSRFMCPIPASPVPEFDPPLLEKMSQLSSTEFRPQQQMRINGIFEPSILKTSGEQKSEKNEAQVLTLEAAEKQTLEYVKRSMDSPAILSADNTTTNVLFSSPFWGSLVGGTLCWNTSSLLNSFNHEADCLEILHETLPEELDSIDLNETASLQCDVDEVISERARSSSENKGDTEKSTLNPQSMFNTHKALNRPAATSEEEVHQTNNKGESVNCGSDRSLVPERREDDEFSSCQEVFCLDEESTKTPSSVPLESRKYSLSSLHVVCEGLAEMASVVHRLPKDLIDKEQLDEQLGTKDPSSEQNL